MFHAMGLIGENMHIPRSTELGLNRAAVGQFNQIVIARPIGDQIADGADLQPMFRCKINKIRQTCHGAVFLHNLADHRGGIVSGKTADVAAGLGVTSANQNAALARP